MIMKFYKQKTNSLFKRKCIGVIYLIFSYIINGNALKFKNDTNEVYNEYCFYWIKNLESTSLIFCNEELGDKSIRNVMEGGNSFSIINNNNTTNVNVTYLYGKINHHYVLFVDSGKGDFMENCVLKQTRLQLLTDRTKLIICDRSPEIPERLKSGSLDFLGSATALYVSRTGCWKASARHFLRRTFDPVQDCSEDFWLFDPEKMPDMGGETVRAVTFDRLIFDVIDHNETDSKKRYDGLEMQIFFEVARMINFTWEIYEIDENVSNKWGKLEDDGKWNGGVLEEVTSGKADLVLAAFWIYETPYLDFSFSWSSLKLAFLVPRPTILGSSWSNLVRPFQGFLWLAVSTLVLAFPLVVWGLEKLYMAINRRHRQLYPLGAYLLYTVGSMTGGSGLINSRRAPAFLRPLVSSWFILVLLLYASYTSNIAAIMTMPSFATKVDTVRQLVEQNFTWGRTYWVDDPAKFLNMDDYWQRQFRNHFVIYNSSEERRLLQGRRFALYVSVLEGREQVLVDSVVDRDILRGLRLMREGLRNYRVCTAFRTHSRLRPSYNRALFRLFEHGILESLKGAALMKYQDASYEQLREDTDHGLNAEPTVLTMDDLRQVFVILVVGLAGSTACFLLELCLVATSSKLKKQSIQHV